MSPQVLRLRPPTQRIIGAAVQSAYTAAVESLVIDFQVGAREKLRWKVLDCETDSVRSAIGSMVLVFDRRKVYMRGCRCVP